MRYKKMTRKEIESELKNINQLCSYMHHELQDVKHLNLTLSKVVDSFIKFSGKEDKFMEYIKKKAEEAKSEQGKQKATKSKSKKLQKKTRADK